MAPPSAFQFKTRSGVFKKTVEELQAASDSKDESAKDKYYEQHEKELFPTASFTTFCTSSDSFF